MTLIIISKTFTSHYKQFLKLFDSKIGIFLRLKCLKRHFEQFNYSSSGSFSVTSFVATPYQHIYTS